MPMSDTPQGLSRFELMSRREGPTKMPQYRQGTGTGSGQPTPPEGPAFQGDWMGEILENARQAGQFDRLPGKGKPQDLPVEDALGGEQAKHFQLMKQAGTPALHYPAVPADFGRTPT